MIEFAERRWKLDVPNEHGETPRHRLESIRRQTGKPQPLLRDIEFPEELSYLWRWFLMLHAGRSSNGMAETIASHVDMMAWQRNSGIQCEPWEIEVLMKLGSTWLAVRNARPTDNVTKPLRAEILAQARR